MGGVLALLSTPVQRRGTRRCWTNDTQQRFYLTCQESVHYRVTNLSRLAQVSHNFFFFFLYPWNSSVLGKPGRLVRPSNWHNLLEKLPHSFQSPHAASLSCSSHMQSLCKVPGPRRDSSVSTLPQLRHTHTHTHTRFHLEGPGTPGCR